MDHLGHDVLAQFVRLVNPIARNGLGVPESLLQVDVLAQLHRQVVLRVAPPQRHQSGEHPKGPTHEAALSARVALAVALLTFVTGHGLQ